MKTIGLLPVRNEEWVIRHSLRSLSGFCDVILVNDQRSEDSTREICREFPKVVLIESPHANVCEIARWELIDAARNYEGFNLLWHMDADELLSPSSFHLFLDQNGHRLEPGTVIKSQFYHLWNTPDRYRDDGSLYAPHWKSFGEVDDRLADFDRSEKLPLHQPRVTAREGGLSIQADNLHVLHLQWLISERNQLKQAWYRCLELMNGRPAAEINARYSITFPAHHARTSSVPAEWVADLTLPDAAKHYDSWQQIDIDQWFCERGVEFFEPLEIWHIQGLRDAFQRSTGRKPRPDRSYMPRLPERAYQVSRKLLSRAKSRLF